MAPRTIAGKAASMGNHPPSRKRSRMDDDDNQEPNLPMPIAPRWRTKQWSTVAGYAVFISPHPHIPASFLWKLEDQRDWTVGKLDMIPSLCYAWPAFDLQQSRFHVFTVIIKMPSTGGARDSLSTEECAGRLVHKGERVAFISKTRLQAVCRDLEWPLD